MIRIAEFMKRKVNTQEENIEFGNQLFKWDETATRNTFYDEGVLDDLLYNARDIIKERS